MRPLGTRVFVLPTRVDGIPPLSKKDYERLLNLCLIGQLSLYTQKSTVRMFLNGTPLTQEIADIAVNETVYFKVKNDLELNAFMKMGDSIRSVILYVSECINHALFHDVHILRIQYMVTQDVVLVTVESEYKLITD